MLKRFALGLTLGLALLTMLASCDFTQATPKVNTGWEQSADKSSEIKLLLSSYDSKTNLQSSGINLNEISAIILDVTDVELCGDLGCKTFAVDKSIDLLKYSNGQVGTVTDIAIDNMSTIFKGINKDYGDFKEIVGKLTEIRIYVGENSKVEKYSQKYPLEIAEHKLVATIENGWEIAPFAINNLLVHVPLAGLQESSEGIFTLGQRLESKEILLTLEGAKSIYVGTEGGTFTLPSGFSIEIPSGALSESTFISIDENCKDIKEISCKYFVEPVELDLAIPISVIIPYRQENVIKTSNHSEMIVLQDSIINSANINQATSKVQAKIYGLGEIYVAIEKPSGQQRNVQSLMPTSVREGVEILEIKKSGINGLKYLVGYLVKIDESINDYELNVLFEPPPLGTYAKYDVQLKTARSLALENNAIVALSGVHFNSPVEYDNKFLSRLTYLIYSNGKEIPGTNSGGKVLIAMSQNNGEGFKTRRICQADGERCNGHDDTYKAFPEEFKYQAVSSRTTLMRGGICLTNNHQDAFTVIGYSEDGHTYMFSSRHRWHNKLTANALCEVLKDYGIYEAILLDGGSSSALVYKKELLNPLTLHQAESLRYGREKKIATIIGLVAVDINSTKPGLFNINQIRQNDIKCENSKPAVSLSWNKSERATTYDIYRNETFYASTSGLTYRNIKGLTAGNTYYYSVVAKNESGETASNNQVVAKIPDNICKNNPPPSSNKEAVLAKILFKLRGNPPYNNPGQVTFGYLKTYGPSNQKKLKLESHAGIDYRASIGTNVYAPISGKVIQVTDGVGAFSIYDESVNKTVHLLHLSYADASLDQQYITKGTLIGRSGAKGTGSPHLHVEVRHGKHEPALGGASCGGWCTHDQVAAATDNPVIILDWANAEPPKTPSKPVPQSPVGKISTLSPIFTWTASNNVDYYEIYIRRLSDHKLFETIRVDGAATSKTITDVRFKNGEKYRWNMQAFNSEGHSGYSSPLEFTIDTGSSENHSPIISSFNANPNSAEIGQKVTFSWSISDPDNDSLTCKVDIYNDGSYDKVIPNCNSSKSIYLKFTTVGVHQTKLLVEDGKGGSDSKLVSVTVNESTPTNHSPVISSFYLSPNPVKINQNGTYHWDISDSDGDNLTCKIDFTNDGNFDSTINNCTADSSVNVTFKGTPGTLTSILVVEDSKGGSATKSLTVVVEEGTPSNQNPIISDFHAAPTTTEVGGEIEFFVTISDPDNDNLTCKLDANGDGVYDGTYQNCMSGDIIPIEFSYTGTFNVKLLVEDGKGGSASAYTAVEITESTPSNQNPVISQFYAAPSTVEVNEKLEFRWVISDPDGDSLTCKIDYENDGVNEEVIPNCTSSDGVLVVYSPADTYTAKLVVEDGKGGSTSEYTTVVITDSAPSNQRPVIHSFVVNPSSISINETVTFTWSISDAENDSLHCYILPYSNVNGGETDNAIYIPNCSDTGSRQFTYRKQGNFRARLQVIDNIDLPAVMKDIFVEVGAASSPGILQVTPSNGFTTSGTQGKRDFSPEEKCYSLQNIGGAAIDWEANDSVSWLTESRKSGSLSPNETTRVCLQVLQHNAEDLTRTREDTVEFVNTTNHNGDTLRNIKIIVNGASPSVDWRVSDSRLTFRAKVGETASSQQFRLYNDGSSSGSYQLRSRNLSWITVSSASGSISGGSSKSISVFVDECTSVGTRSGQLTISGDGDTATIDIEYQCEAAPAQNPTISGVTPSNPKANNSAVPLNIWGTNFKYGANVYLKYTPDGTCYSITWAKWREDYWISISGVNLGGSPARWQVRVTNNSPRSASSWFTFYTSNGSVGPASEASKPVIPLFVDASGITTQANEISCSRTD